MEDIKKVFIAELLSKPPELMASIWIMDRVPFLFGEDRESYANWRCTLASGLGVDPSSLVITGSCAFGLSLNPNKNYRFFNSESDIDIAVISDYHFTSAWRALRSLGSGIHALPPVTRNAVQEHVKKYIYWGTVATDRILHMLPFGREWNQVIDTMKNTPPTIGRTIKARIYRDFDSLRAYQVNNLKNLRIAEIEKGIL
ncbi:MAG: hypothetical protein HYZ31_10385 [Gammaproteobacteria bacterium]|nr:hypothetical protein [Gammaproteobacteria bacterium]